MTNENNDNNKFQKQEDELFAIPMSRLVILSVLTLGTYQIYWFYRNWKALKQTDSSIKHPFWRSLFVIFFCYSFFKLIFKIAESRGHENKYSLRFLTFFYITLLLVGNAWGKAHNISKPADIALMILSLSAIIPLIPVQQAIIFVSKKEKLNTIFKPKVGEIILVVVGIILFILVSYGTFLTNHTTPDQQNTANEMLTKANELSDQYKQCSTSLLQRKSTIDETNQAEVDSYNGEFNSCDAIRTQQNNTVNEYNKLIGAK